MLLIKIQNKQGLFYLLNNWQLVSETLLFLYV
jgi:hypothetical protein